MKVDVTKKGSRETVKRTVDIFRARIIDVHDASYTIEATGSSERLNALLDALAFDVTLLEVVRSGSMGIARGKTVFIHLIYKDFIWFIDFLLHLGGIEWVQVSRQPRPLKQKRLIEYLG